MKKGLMYTIYKYIGGRIVFSYIAAIVVSKGFFFYRDTRLHRDQLETVVSIRNELASSMDAIKDPFLHSATVQLHLSIDFQTDKQTIKADMRRKLKREEEQILGRKKKYSTDFCRSRFSSAITNPSIYYHVGRTGKYIITNKLRVIVGPFFNQQEPLQRNGTRVAAAALAQATRIIASSPNQGKTSRSKRELA